MDREYNLHSFIYIIYEARLKAEQAGLDPVSHYNFFKNASMKNNTIPKIDITATNGMTFFAIFLGKNNSKKYFSSPNLLDKIPRGQLF